MTPYPSKQRLADTADRGIPWYTVPVSKVTDDIRAYLALRADGLARKTLKNELDVLRCLLDYPVSRGILRSPVWNPLASANPARRVSGCDAPSGRLWFPRALTFDEDVKLLELAQAAPSLDGKLSFPCNSPSVAVSSPRVE